MKYLLLIVFAALLLSADFSKKASNLPAPYTVFAGTVVYGYELQYDQGKNYRLIQTNDGKWFYAVAYLTPVNLAPVGTVQGTLKQNKQLCDFTAIIQPGDSVWVMYDSLGVLYQALI